MDHTNISQVKSTSHKIYKNYGKEEAKILFSN